MASLSKEPGRNSWKLSWLDDTKRRRAIRLGSMPKRTAEQFLVRFEELLGVRRGGGVLLPAALKQWTDSLGDKLRGRLETAGLLEPRTRMTLGEFCDAFTDSRSDRSPATRVRDQQVTKLLIERLGRDREMESITVRDAEEWRRWLATAGNRRDKEQDGLSDNTVRRRTGVARQLFATAIRWGYLTKNPFDGLATSVRENLERRAFVSWADTLRVIEVAPDTQWRALIAFVRLTGCRVPSELQQLTWADVDFTARTILIRSPKTAHHGGDHALRSVPLFPELVPFLEALADVVGPGVETPLSSPVFPLATDPKANLRTQFARLIVRAGFAPWPKVFVNLRSSRETELLSIYPAADVCRWFGHSPAVAAKFYAQARPEIAEHAATQTTVGLPGNVAGNIRGTAGAIMGNIGTHQEDDTNPHRQQKTQENKGSLTNPDDSGGFAMGVMSGRYWTRNMAQTSRKTATSESAGNVVGNIISKSHDAGTEELLTIWSTLDVSRREALLGLARGMLLEIKHAVRREPS